MQAPAFPGFILFLNPSILEGDMENETCSFSPLSGQLAPVVLLVIDHTKGMYYGHPGKGVQQSLLDGTAAS